MGPSGHMPPHGSGAARGSGARNFENGTENGKRLWLLVLIGFSVGFLTNLGLEG